MRNLIIAVIATLFFSNVALAADSGCEAKAISKSGKPLAGAAKSAFMKKCEKDAAGAATPAVAAAAAAVTPAAAAPAVATAPSCEAKAVSKSGKPLTGAAKAASIKKCEADAKK